MGQETNNLSGYPRDGDAARPEPSTTAYTDQPEMNADTVAIEVEIEQTRADMGDTIDAIQERLNPERLKDEALERARDATIGRASDMVNSAEQTAKDAGASMIDTIKSNPIPAALAGVGIAWLWMKRPQGSDAYSSMRMSQRRQYSPYGAYWQPSSQQTAQESGGLGQAVDSVQQTAGQVADQAGQMASGAAHQVEHLGGAAQSQSKRMLDGVDRMLHERPLASGVVALGLGAAVGMLLPETQTEDHLLGDARDSVVQKVETAGQQAMQRAQDVAQDITQDVTKDVKKGMQSPQMGQQPSQQPPPLG